MAELPQFIFLKLGQGAFNSGDLKVESDDQPAPESSERIEFEYHMFEVEKARIVPGHVHIRTPYTNKYWVRESAGSDLIVAEANEPEEDQSKWSCTLFQPFFVDADDVFSSQNIKLLHVSESWKRWVTLNSNGKLALGGMMEYYQRSGFRQGRLTFSCGAAAILPEYVAFVGPNKRYLVSEKNWGGMTRLVFKSDDIGGKGVAQRICYSSPGESMKIMDKGTGSYWTINHTGLLNNCIVPGPKEKATSFSAIKLDDNRIVINCKSGGPAAGKYGRSTDGGVLKIDATGIVENGILWIEEPVIAREISNATYRLEDYTLKTMTTISKFMDTRSNQTDVEQRGSIQVEYKVSKTMSWSRSKTINLGIKCSWSAGTPQVGKLGVEISHEGSSTLEWGEEQTEEKTVTYSQEIKIPPGKRVTLQVEAQRAEFVVPFSCKVRDLMTWGEVREYELSDGQYKGCNEFQFETKLTYT